METGGTGVSEGEGTAQASIVTDEDKPNAGKDSAEPARGIEQRPFLTQTELLIKMKAGDEEEVKR